jgi:hypothetical protein
VATTSYDSGWTQQDVIIHKVTEFSRDIQSEVEITQFWLFWLYKSDAQREEAVDGLDAIQTCLLTMEDVNDRDQSEGMTATIEFRPTIKEAVKKTPKSRCHSFLLLPRRKAK